jgi:L-threonylcarbamoyladenylate synthase
MTHAHDANVLDAAAPHAIEWVAQTILEGGVVALPTDTVYGIAASVANDAALARIYEIKGRDASQPLPILVDSPDVLERLSPGIDPRVALLLDRFWPGPLTVAIPARPGLARPLIGPGETVGVRMPNHPLALEIIGKVGGMIACTSANYSGEPPASTAAEVVATVGPALDVTLDGGNTPGGIPSTVIAIRDGQPVVLREGAIAAEEIATAWQDLADLA